MWEDAKEIWCISFISAIQAFAIVLIFAAGEFLKVYGVMELMLRILFFAVILGCFMCIFVAFARKLLFFLDKIGI